MRSNLSYVYHAPSFHYSPCIVWNDFVKCFVRYRLGMAASWYGIKTKRMFIIITDIIFVKTFTLADFAPIIFYPKARNSRHITFCDKTA